MSEIHVAPVTGFWSFFLGENNHKTKNSSELWARRIIGLIWFVVPLLIFALGTTVFKSGPKDGQCVKWRPPGPVYAGAWTLLVLLLMACWLSISRECSSVWLWSAQVVTFFLLIFLAIMWMYAYHQPDGKINGITVFIFLLMIFFLELPLAWKTSVWTLALLLPLGVWAVFQLGVNCAEMNCLEDGGSKRRKKRS